MRLRLFMWFSLSVAMVTFVVIGCSQPATSVPVSSGLPASKEASDKPATVVKRAEFENWNQFPVGTSVTKSREISKGDNKVKQTTVYRLVSKDDSHIVVESTVSLNHNGETQTNEPTSLEYAATFQLPAGMSAEQFSLPSPAAKSSGTESIEVLGRMYEATIYKWQGNAEAGPVDNTLWMSNEVPGRAIKHVSNCVGTITEESIINLEIPAAKGG